MLCFPVLSNYFESYFEISDIDENDTTNFRKCAVRTNDFHYIALAQSKILTIIRKAVEGNTDDFDVSADLEFDGSIEALCWDTKGRCILIALDTGIIYYVSNSNNVLFSHHMRSGTFTIGSYLNNSNNLL